MVHFRPHSPTLAAGLRTLPPMSLPMERQDPPKAIRAEHPPELPPGDKAVLSGFTQCPQNEWHSSAMMACGRFVLQNTIAPSDSRIVTRLDVSVAISRLDSPAEDGRPV